MGEGGREEKRMGGREKEEVVERKGGGGREKDFLCIFLTYIKTCNNGATFKIKHIGRL